MKSFTKHPVMSKDDLKSLLEKHHILGQNVNTVYDGDSATMILNIVLLVEDEDDLNELKNDLKCIESCY